MIRVLNYRKAYDTLVAVHDLSFDVRPGEIVGLVGPNGAGKTTTMRAIAGIITPTAGRIALSDGEAGPLFDVQTNPVQAKRLLAYVPDDPKLFETLTVDEHLRFTAAAFGLRDYHAAADALLERFELTPKRRALAQELSRGMRQKAAICCALLHDPRAILMDEPLTGLDPRGIRTMKETIRERAAGGAAVMISSHLLSLVEDLCTSLLILHKGRKLFAGSLAEAKAAFGGGSAGDASLEEVFFRATEGGPPVQTSAAPVESDARPTEPGR